MNLLCHLAEMSSRFRFDESRKEWRLSFGAIIIHYRIVRKIVTAQTGLVSCARLRFKRALTVNIILYSKSNDA